MELEDADDVVLDDELEIGVESDDELDEAVESDDELTLDGDSADELSPLRVSELVLELGLELEQREISVCESEETTSSWAETESESQDA